MLSTADQESILDDLRVDIPLKYNFHFMASHVEVITGKQEGTCAKLIFKLILLPFCISQTLKPLYLTVLSCCASLSPPYPPSHSSTMNLTGIKKVLGKFKFLGVENSEFLYNLKLISYLLWYSWFLSSPLFNFFLTGIYSWIGVNFELGRFDHSHDAKGRYQQLKLFEVLDLMRCVT